jgi:hypothetical protein
MTAYGPQCQGRRSFYRALMGGGDLPELFTYVKHPSRGAVNPITLKYLIIFLGAAIFQFKIVIFDTKMTFKKYNLLIKID